ncbi:DUF2726 domain-containing protein [bacterium]|nr:DUF2726 domain-containing protein [bacterium]
MGNVRKEIFLKGERRTNDIVSCVRSGKVFKITFKGHKTYTYNYYDVKIVEPSKEELFIDSRLDYFKSIADKIGLEHTTDKGLKFNILLKNYGMIEKVIPETILYTFLKGELPVKEKKQDSCIGAFFKIIKPIKNEEKEFTIFPFGFNISQKQAVDYALDNNLSIIEGPPGTGKTQTILNIIANAVIRGESVAVVSSNNSATKNIIDKLKKYGVDFISAYLGNTENKEEFIKFQTSVPSMLDWKLENNQIKDIQESLKQRYKHLQEKLEQQNILSKIRQDLSAYEIEYSHHLKYIEQFNIKEIPQDIINIKSADKALEMSFYIEIADEENKNKNKFLEIIKTIIEFLKIKKFKRTIAEQLLKKYSKECLIALYQQKFYELKIAENKKNIENLEKELNSFDFSAKMKEYSELSTQIFKAKLAEKYSIQKRNTYTIYELQTKSEDFIIDYPVVLSTTYSLRTCLSKDVMYDYVIVDEASQVDLCTGVLALSCAKKSVIVGDLKQLPNVVDTKDAKLTDEVFGNFNMPEVYRYKNHCLLSSISELFKNVPHTLLKEHYRCHPRIIEFCNKKFYNNELIILSNIQSDKKPLIVYKTVAGNHSRDNVNQRQIDVIKNEIIPNENLCTTDDSLGIVTPYRNQTNALQTQFKGTGVKADTVDKFQGQENKVIILSTVDNNITDFTDNPNRLNVAISRAIEQLIVVINGNEQQKDTTINELVKYIEYNNCEIKESKIFSIFDLLYKNYAKQRQIFLRKYNKISEYDSENLMYALLDDILEKYNGNYDVAVHVPLNMIIRDFSLMTNDERKYAKNDWTHVDFLIYKTIDKSPVLAIEVDGSKYHKEDTKQAKRDELKNTIFEKYDIPLCRFSTTGSNEKEKLMQILKEKIGEM